MAQRMFVHRIDLAFFALIGCLLITSCIGIPYNPCSVWPGANYTSGRCLLQTGAITKGQAEKFCGRLPMSGRLAEPRTPALVAAYLKLSLDTNGVWIGAEASHNLQEMVWESDGSAIPLDVQGMWGNNQPNNLSRQRCAALGPDGLHDAACDKRFAGLCELKVGDPCEKVYNGSVFFEGYCFKVYHGLYNWFDALERCKNDGSYLAEVKTKALYDGVIAYVKPITDAYVYIGGSDEEEEGIFKWITSNENFSAEAGDCWATYEPNDIEDIEHYVMLQHTKTYEGFVDVAGVERIPYLCQRDILPPSWASRYQFTVVVPAMTSSTLAYTRKLYVTTGLEYVPLKVISSVGSSESEEHGFVTSSKPFVFDIDSEMDLTYAGVYNKHVIIHSWFSVTVVYVSMATDSAGSTLIYPSTLTSGEAERGRIYFVPSPSTQDGSEDQLAIVAMENKTSVINVYLGLSTNGMTLNIDSFLFRNVRQVEATLNNQYETLYNNDMQQFLGKDAILVLATESVSVLVSSDLTTSESNTSDFVIESVLPIEFIDTEYFTFPSFDGQACQDVFRLVAVYDNTTVEVSLQFRYGPVTMDKGGDTHDLKLDCDYSYHLQGSEPFYVYKLSTEDTRNRPCMTSLMPQSVWRSQYDVTVTSEFTGYEVSVHVIVQTLEDPPLTVTPDYLTPDRCNPILGSDNSYTWCHYKIPSDNLEPPATFHLSHTSTFGAYMYSVGPHSAVCHSLGVNEEALPSHGFNVASFLPNLEREQSQTTCETIEKNTTSESNKTNTAPISEAKKVAMTTTQNPIFSLANRNLSKEELMFLLDNIYNVLHVDARSTSAYVRKLKSVPDKRMSSWFIGTMGVAFVIGTLALLVLPDILTILKGVLCYFCQKHDKT